MLHLNHNFKFSVHVTLNFLAIRLTLRFNLNFDYIRIQVLPLLRFKSKCQLKCESK